LSEDAAAVGLRVPLADVRLPPEAVAAAVEVLEGGWLSSGPAVERFEADVAARVGTSYAVACSSCTAALQLALAALGVGEGDEVVMPSLSFVAGANVARELGAEPVFADVIGSDDLTADPESLRRLLTPRTRAVVPMHYGGHPCSAELVAVAREAGIAVVEDAAHALGAAGDLGECGGWGDAGCFSFFANKNLPLGEGGMLVTSDEELAERARTLRSHGMTTQTWQRHRGHASSYDVVALGYNHRLDEMRAAIGTVLLERLDDWNARRGDHVARYRSLLSELPGVALPFSGRRSGERPAHHLEVVLLERGIDRDALRAELLAAGIQTSVHYPPTHLFSVHAGARADVAVTEELAGRLLTLPLYPHLEQDQVELVVAALGDALSR
jgi:dTDP-4-amino-4,6-dideoxygalactose transaminase